MRGLTNEQCLRIWEHAYAATPISKAIGILRLAHPERAPEELVALPIGERDRCLIELRRHTFGDKIEAFDTCPQCEAAVEFSFSLGDILTKSLNAEGAASRTVETAVGDFALRPLNSKDIAVLAERAQSLDTDALLHCDALSNEAKDALQSLPAEERRQALSHIESALEQIDPLAQVSFSLACPECQRKWESPFDIVNFLWREIERAAKALLDDIHVLATQYGWSESDILSMSQIRRSLYINHIAS